MKRFVKTPFYIIELPEEQFSTALRKIISYEVQGATYEYMEKYHKVPHKIDIYEKPRTTYPFELDILREPKTGMYKYKGELISYSKMEEIVYSVGLKDYEIEIY